MEASFSALNRLRDRRAALGVSSAFLAKLGGVSAASMSDYLRGLRKFDNQTELRLLRLTDSLVTYIEAVKPFKLPLDDADAVEQMLEHFQENLSPEDLQQTISKLVGR
jgi:transcriptional regulator with XRE-family HTH domain